VGLRRHGDQHAGEPHPHLPVARHVHRHPHRPPEQGQASNPASLAPDASVSVQFVVTATQTITNGDYRATADGNLSAVGQKPVVTFVGQPVTKYYYFGSTRIAMRKGGVLYYLHGDHLGSTSLTTDASGGIVAQSRYLPYGQERWTSGAAQTDFTFTGQRNERGFGLMDYGARYYDPALLRFISPDSVVRNPDSTHDLNRYSYGRDNPLKYIDPTGHQVLVDAVAIAFAASLLMITVYETGPGASERRQALATTVQKAGEGLATTASDVVEGIREGFSPPPVLNGRLPGYPLGVGQPPDPLAPPSNTLSTPELKPSFPGAPLEQPAPGDLMETFPLGTSTQPSSVFTSKQSQIDHQEGVRSKQRAGKYAPQVAKQRGGPSWGGGIEQPPDTGKMTGDELEETVDQAANNPDTPIWKRVIMKILQGFQAPVGPVK
jgi:RHS repeat-associated protein